MKTFKKYINELYKDYPGKGWVLGTKDEPKPKDKGKFNMYAKSDKSGKIVFDFGTKSTFDDAKAFASLRKWQEKK